MSTPLVRKVLTIIPFVKAAMLLGLLIFYFAWYIPEMRRIERNRREEERRFNESQLCADSATDWPVKRKCYQDFLDWVATDREFQGAVKEATKGNQP